MSQEHSPATLSRDEIERFRRGDILLSDEQANRFCDLALSALSETPRSEPAAYLFNGNLFWHDGLVEGQRQRATPLYFAPSAIEPKAAAGSLRDLAFDEAIRAVGFNIDRAKGDYYRGRNDAVLILQGLKEAK